MNKRTKIVCTIGPGTDQPGILENMLKSGMNVARFNFSHGTHEQQEERMNMVRDAALIVRQPVALMLDTKGPEVRLGLFEKGTVYLQAGQTFTLTTKAVMGNQERSTVSYAGLIHDVSIGDRILLADGLVEVSVVEITDTDIVTYVNNSGEIGDRKRVAVPGVPLHLPAVSAQDEADLRFGCQQHVDYIAASFIQRGEDVVAIRRILESEGKGNDIKIIAKIENAEGLKNFDDILKMADGVMVARGDLGVEIPAEEVPVLQKMIIRKCNEAGKVVITATQMLESMIHQPRPTRAEASDVANAILDGTDAIMLSGETANGTYPVEAVQTMTRIAEVTEQASIYDNAGRQIRTGSMNTTESICAASVDVANNLGASAIITCTETGATAIGVACHRPSCQVVAVTPHTATIRRMQLYWGVQAIKGPACTNSDDMVTQSIHQALADNCISSGDLVVVTAGVQSGSHGTTNMIRVHVAGNVLIDSNSLGNTSATGRIYIASRHESHEHFQPGDILVIGTMEPNYMALAKQAGALITVEDGFTSDGAIIGINLGIPVILGAKEAERVLEDGQIVTVDGVRGKVFEGTVNAR